MIELMVLIIPRPCMPFAFAIRIPVRRDRIYIKTKLKDSLTESMTHLRCTRPMTQGVSPEEPLL